MQGGSGAENQPKVSLFSGGIWSFYIFYPAKNMIYLKSKRCG
jgi:hypothetical protein